MRPVTVQTASATGLAIDATIGEHRVRLDEPVSVPGGTNTGPEPTEMLLAALGACQAITMKMYAARKGWALRDVRVRLHGATIDGVFMIRRQLAIDGELDEAQRVRLVEIAGRCPVHRILTNEVRVEDVEAASIDAVR